MEHSVRNPLVMPKGDKGPLGKKKDLPKIKGQYRSKIPFAPQKGQMGKVKENLERNVVGKKEKERKVECCPGKKWKKMPW